MEPRPKKSKLVEARNNPEPVRRGRGRPKGSTNRTKIAFPFTFNSKASSSSASSESESAEAVAEEVKSPDVITKKDAATDTIDLKISSTELYYRADVEKAIRDLYTSHKEAKSETKSNQWCSNCEEKSRFHCCWNTSYCSLECQKIHWENGHAGPCRHPSHPHQEVAVTLESESESEYSESM